MLFVRLPYCVPPVQSYVWQDKAASAPVPWVRLVAALLLTTVTDALMRIGRAVAHLVLLLYRIPVKRKVCPRGCIAVRQWCHETHHEVACIFRAA